MDYEVNVEEAGTHKINIRVASLNGVSQGIEVLSGTTSLTTLDIPNTGGWQNWTTISADVTLPVGQQTIRLSVKAGDYNVNMIEFMTYSTASDNLLTNSGFETGSLSGWNTWNDGVSAANVDQDQPYNSNYKLTLYSGTNYKQSVSQSLQVTNGTYRLTAWVRSGG